MKWWWKLFCHCVIAIEKGNLPVTPQLTDCSSWPDAWIVTRSEITDYVTVKNGNWVTTCWFSICGDFLSKVTEIRVWKPNRQEFSWRRITLHELRSCNVCEKMFGMNVAHDELMFTVIPHVGKSPCYVNIHQGLMDIN